MRAVAVVLVSTLSLVIAASGVAQTHTTNAPQIVTIRVTVTDTGITMKPKVAARGGYAIFLLANHTSKPHKLVLGDAHRRAGRIGFATTLPANGQHRIVMYLDYRGPLPYYSATVPKKASYRGVFTIT